MSKIFFVLGLTLSAARVWAGCGPPQCNLPDSSSWSDVYMSRRACMTIAQNPGETVRQTFSEDLYHGQIFNSDNYLVGTTTYWPQVGICEYDYP